MKGKFYIGFSKNQIATAIAILFHTIGFVGIVFFKSNFIIQATPFNLILMLALLIWTQQKNNFFWMFLLSTILIGFVVEMVGVNTNLLFGHYNYGSVLGFKINNVPLIIGINWFIIMYCCGISINTFLSAAINKLAAKDPMPLSKLKVWSVIIDGATFAVIFDWLMEPVAIQLGYWNWAGAIPFYNYVCWFIISVIILSIFYFCTFNKQNKFAIHLLMIQVLFFLLLRAFFNN